MRYVVVVCLLLASCMTAGHERIASYGKGFPDAKIYVGERIFTVKFHPSESTVMVGRGAAGAFNMALQNAGLDPEPLFVAAANAVLRPLGCEAREAYAIDNVINMEVRYACDASSGPVPRAVVETHRATWREGVRVASPL